MRLRVTRGAERVRRGNDGDTTPPKQVTPRLPGGFHLPPFGVHQLLALVIVCIALWAVGAIWLSMQAAGQWVGSWQDEIHIHVYLDRAAAERGPALQENLAMIDQVASVRRISADEAARWMQTWLKDSSLSQRELAARLPETYELTLAEGESEFLFDDIRDVAEASGARVNEDEVGLAQAHHWIAQARYLVGFASLILALAMALIISNTLRMSLLARAEEIHLMRLMGAKEWFVRIPFILEGMLLGAGAGLAAWLLLWPVVWTTADWFIAMQINVSNWLLFFPLLLGGALVGALGAVVATVRVNASELST